MLELATSSLADFMNLALMLSETRLVHEPRVTFIAAKSFQFKMITSFVRLKNINSHSSHSYNLRDLSDIPRPLVCNILRIVMQPMSSFIFIFVPYNQIN